MNIDMKINLDEEYVLCALLFSARKQRMVRQGRLTYNIVHIGDEMYGISVR